MKYITVEYSIYQISDKNYEKLEALGARFLEMLEYDEVLEMLSSLGATHLGDIYQDFKF